VPAAAAIIDDFTELTVGPGCRAAAEIALAASLDHLSPSPAPACQCGALGPSLETQSGSARIMTDRIQLL
jgi:hypothetical protein